MLSSPHISLNGKHSMWPTGRDLARTCVISDNLRLSLDRFPDGWGWRTWEARKDDGWQPLPPPALENTRRRFRMPEQAEQFFRLLAELVLEDGTTAQTAEDPPPERRNDGEN